MLAFELLRRGERTARRAAGILPFLAPALVYLVVRSALGYGTRGSGFYSDPLHEPWEYLRGAPWRLVALLAQGWLTYNVEPGAGTGEKWGIFALVVGGAAVLVVPARRALAALEPDRRRTAAWMILGSLFALVPVLAVVPSARLLGISMLGVAPLVALVLERAWFPAAPETRRGAAELSGLVATALGFAHLMHGPSLSWIIAEKHRKDAADFQVHTADLHERIGEVARADIVVVRGLMGMFFAPFALDARGSAPRRFRPLAHTGHVLVLRRDARTLELVVAADRGLFPAGQGNLFRTDTARMRAGDELLLPGARATVLEVGEFGPRRVRFAFDDDLDTAHITWISETFEGFTTAALPPEGFGAPFDP